MPSPFPGMNPYFEQPGVWRGFHTEFIVELKRAITPHAVPRYFVNVEQSIYIERDDGGREMLGVSDGLVGVGPSSPTPNSDTATVLAPVTGSVRIGAIKRRHRWLTVRDTATREVVTVIELLGPSNKWGEDRGSYLRKRRRILRSAAHLVEIDLLRGGPRMPVAGVPVTNYRVMVSRRPQRPDVQVWPFNLRDPLPTIPIPFRTGEPEPHIDLKPVLDTLYDTGGYHYQLYIAPPDPPLAPDDQEWARQFVPAGR